MDDSAWNIHLISAYIYILYQSAALRKPHCAPLEVMNSGTWAEISWWIQKASSAKKIVMYSMYSYYIILP